jgi:mycothiol synthase
LTDMNTPAYIIRNFHPDDLSSYVELSVEAAKLAPAGRPASPQAISEELGRPNHLPEQNLFLAELAGKVIGYMDVRAEPAIARAMLDCFVHPEHRRKGLTTELFHHASRRARELGARMAQANVAEDNAAAKALLSKLGFRFARRFLNLTLELSKARLPDEEDVALSARHLQRGEEEELARIQNRSFAGTWGYNPNTLEEVVYRLNMTGSSPEDVILVFDGDRPAGYCWTRTRPEASAGAAYMGRIMMLGVDPDYRGRGIGKRALLAGLAHLKSKGIQVAGLTVDSQNAVAYALYESCGFQFSSAGAWYEKTLD